MLEENQTTNEAAMERIYREHVHLVRRFLQSRCGSAELAADLTARTFEQAFLRVREGRADEITLAWLMFVARRRLVDHWRRLDRASAAQRVLETEAMRPPEAGLDYSVIDALQRIQPNHSRSLYLKYVLDLSTADVAGRMGMSYRAAESVLRRARVALRNELSTNDHRLTA